MKVTKLSECGLNNALLGLSLSYYDHAKPLEDWWTPEKMERALVRAKKLAHAGGGHDKFLRSITVTLFIQGSRDFWSEFDTYQVGMTKNSSSTMHTLSKRYVNKDDFEVGTSWLAITLFNFKLWQFKTGSITLSELKKNLPEGWLQERVVVTNYATLANIYKQRKNHKLEQWREFCSQLRLQVDQEYFLVKEKRKNG